MSATLRPSIYPSILRCFKAALCASSEGRSSSFGRVSRTSGASRDSSCGDADAERFSPELLLEVHLEVHAFALRCTRNPGAWAWGNARCFDSGTFLEFVATLPPGGSTLLFDQTFLLVDPFL